MLVSDYIDFAISSELKPLTVSDIGGEDPTPVQLSNRATLVNYVHLANVEIHKKFSLIQKEFLLSGATNNTLHDIPIDWLFGINASFEDGTEVALNNEKITKVDDVDTNVSVLFPSPFTALVKGTDPQERTDISLLYCAAPAKVTKFTDFIDLSQVFTEAMLYYIAFKAYASMQGDLQATNNTYYLRFLESCKNIDIKGLVNPDNLDSNTKFDDRGFV